MIILTYKIECVSNLTAISVWTSCISTLHSHMLLMSMISGSLDLAEGCLVAQIPENTKGFGVRWIWFPKVFPFLEKIGMGQKKPLVGAVVEGEQFSPTG